MSLINMKLPTPLHEMAQLPQWSFWAWAKPKEEGKKPAKRTCNARGVFGGHNAIGMTQSLSELYRLAELSAGDMYRDIAGIGFAPSGGDPYLFIDIDDCRDPATGKLDDVAAGIVDAACTYTEISPSGTGLRLIGYAEGWNQGSKRGYRWANDELRGEIYYSVGWVTITGNVLRDCPVGPLGAFAEYIYGESEGRHAEKHDDNVARIANPETLAPIEVIRETLGFIDNKGLDWDYWRSVVGLAVYAASDGSEEGMLAWDEWSRRCDGYSEGDCEAAWEEMERSPPDNVSFGKLLFEAQQCQRAKGFGQWVGGAMWKAWRNGQKMGGALPRVPGEDSDSGPPRSAAAVAAAGVKGFSLGGDSGDDIGVSNDTWEAFLQRPNTKKGDATPYGNILNAGIMFRYADVWKGVLAYDDFSDRPLLLNAPPWYGTEYYGSFDGPRPLTDNDATRATAWMQGVTGAQISQSTMFQAIMSECEKNKINVVRDYLDSVVWDGVNRLDRVIIDYLGAEDTDINRAFTAKTLIAAVARIYRPGCKVKTVLVLKGPQDIGKSKFCAALVPNPSWYTDVCPDMTNKDAMQQLRGIWIQEHAEMATLSKAEAARAKAFVSSNVDRYRPSYGKLAQEFPRQCVFIATVNPESTGFLRDATGASRYWIIACGVGWDTNKVIDDAALAAVRDQIWAEAVARFKAGETWWLDTPALRGEQIRIADEDYEEDVWSENVAAFLMQNPQPVTTDEVLVGAMRKEIGYLSRSDQMRAGTVLSRLGRVRKKVKRPNGTTKWVYADPSNLEAKGAAVTKTEELGGGNVVPLKR